MQTVFSYRKKGGVVGATLACGATVLVGKLKIFMPEYCAIPQKINIITTKTPTPTPIAFNNALLFIKLFYHIQRRPSEMSANKMPIVCVIDSDS